MNLFSDNKNATNSNTYDIKQFSIRGIDDTRFPIFKVSPNNVHIIFLSRQVNFFEYFSYIFLQLHRNLTEGQVVVNVIQKHLGC